MRLHSTQSVLMQCCCAARPPVALAKTFPLDAVVAACPLGPLPTLPCSSQIVRGRQLPL